MGLFGLISLDLLDRFSQSLHCMKAHYVRRYAKRGICHRRVSVRPSANNATR